MPNFFAPTTGKPLTDAATHPLSKLIVKLGGTAKFGLYGLDDLAQPLSVKLVRAGAEIDLKNGRNEQIGGKVTLLKSKGGSASFTIFSMTGLHMGDVLQSYSANGAPFPCSLPVEVVSDHHGGVMAEWNAWLNDPIGLQAFLSQNDSLYPGALPYLKWSGGVTLKSKSHALGSVNGLSVHTTGNGTGTKVTSDKNLVSGRCLSTWNKNGASAHFAITGDGTVAQFVPGNRSANAQHSPSNESWLSVEVDNDGISPMLDTQLEALKALYSWVQIRYQTPGTLATGYLPPGKPAFDKITNEICTVTTTKIAEAIASKGLSCHWWLDANKGHACPGPGILAQLPSIVSSTTTAYPVVWPWGLRTSFFSNFQTDGY
jgi:N-acetylmuramoyl-L-alanine amidase